MDHLWLKSCFGLLIFTLTMLSGLIAHFCTIFFISVHSHGHKEYVMRLVLAFSGGIMLSTGLLHLYPDAAEQLKPFSERTNGTGTISYPLAEASMMIGLLCVLVFENISQTFNARFHHHHHSHTHPHMHHSANECLKNDVVFPVSHTCIDTCIEGSYSSMSSESHFNPLLKCSGTYSDSVRDIECSNDRHLIPVENDVTTTSNYTEGDVRDYFKSEFKSNENGKSSGRKTGMIRFLLLLALSFHSVMEGVALGTVLSDPFTTGVVILAHKVTTSFALAISLIKESTKRSVFWVELLLFALMTPFGIAVGCLISSLQLHESTFWLQLRGILTGLGAGTFLEVSLLEFIGPEIQRCREKNCSQRSRWGLLAMWILGAGLISLRADRAVTKN